MRRARPEQAPGPAEQWVCSADGTMIAFERAGQGPALILVTGALTDRTVTRSVAAELAPRFTVYAYDRRGRGSSGDTAPYSAEREVEDLAAVIGAAGGPALVFGHSSGAVLALEAAARGLAITKLAAYEPPYLTDASGRRPADDLAGRLAALVASGRRAETIRLFWAEGPGFDAKTIALMEASPMWPGLLALAHTVPYDVALCGPGMRMPADRIAAIRIPVLLLDGGLSADRAGPPMKALADAIPDARRVTLDGQGHGAAADVLAPVLTEFFRARG
jgi:pimeloyl-ACP methyl ester carboxylesterase